MIPDKNIEAEKSLIASILMNPELLETCDAISPDDFYSLKHQKIYRTILTMNSKREDIDAGTVWHELKKEHGPVIDPDYLVRIMEDSPLFETRKYSKLILECSISRQVKTECTRIMESQQMGESLLSDAQSSLMSIKSTAREDSIKKLSDIISTHIDRLEKANTTEEGLYYKLGFPRIDARLKTIGPKLIIIAGRPGMGKTALLLTMSKNLDRAGVCVGVLSIEMPEVEMVDRWLSMESGVDSSKFGKFNGFKNKDFQNISDAASVFYESKLMIDGTGSLDIVDVERKCRKMVRSGAQVIFIDQLSQIGNKDFKGSDITQRYSENCNRIARIKKELGIPIFLLAQLNRDLKNRSNKEPVLSDLKQTGSLEEDADAVIFVHRPEEYASDSEKEVLKGLAIIDLAKNRSGAQYKDKNVFFTHETTYFYNG